MKTISVAEALQIKNPVFIDVRSPGEFAEGTIPDAQNIPIFSDEERASVGTVYKQVDPDQARELGLDYVSPKLPSLIKEIKEVSAGRTPVVFCWRGGARSDSICRVLDLMGVKGYRLEGGYREYRQYVTDRLKSYELATPVIVLHGYTGSGKTEILQRLATLGHPVLDLEYLAGHRGSAFGSIGIGHVRTQKEFDALLLRRLDELQSAPYILLEAESKRIGRVNMPDFLFQKKEKGLPILINTSLEVRVDRIIEEYARAGVTAEFIETCQGALRAIQKKLTLLIGKAGFQELEDALNAENLAYVTRVLLEVYYDPLYQHSQDKYPEFVLKVDADDMEQAIQTLDQFLNNLPHN